MSRFYELQPDIFAKFGPRLVDELDDEISFVDGDIIQKQISLPIRFSSKHSAQNPPLGFYGRVVPIASEGFLGVLQKNCVNNLQCFPAEIVSSVDGTVWKNYQAVNIIGKVSCADLGNSEFTEIIDRPGDLSLPLMAFEELKVNPERVSGTLLFRLAESPGTVIVAESIVKALRAIKPDKEWGITLDEVSS